MVFQLSDGAGGELCLAEPGLVIRLRNGDGVIFRSSQITHFNLPFKGKRFSAMARQLARYNRDHGKEYNPADLDDSEPPLVPPGAEIPISQVTTPQDEAPHGGASRGGAVAATSTGPARKSKGKGKQKAAPHDDDEYQDEPHDDGAQEGQSSKRGKKTGGTRAPAQADTTDAAPKRSKINTWDFPHELDRSKLGQYILELEELEKLVDADGKLSSADVWRFIGIHGLDPAVLPRINKVRTGHAYVVTFY